MDLWLQMFFLIGFPAMFFVTIALWAIDHIWLTPDESKIIKKAKRKKRPLVIHVGDEGYAKFEILETLGPEGYASTSKKSKQKWMGFFPRTPRSTEIEAEKKEAKIASFINKLASKKAFLKDAKIPVWFAYTGKAVLTSLYNLAGIKIMEERPKGNPSKAVVVDLQEIKALFDEPWDESQIRAQETDAYEEGSFTSKKFYGMDSMKMFVLPGMIIMGILVLAIVLLVLGK